MTDPEQAYRETLQRFGAVIDFDISALDRLGVPVTSCSLAVDGVLTHHGNGYGARVEDAELSGLGELAEGVLSERSLRAASETVQTASRRELLGRYGTDAVVDPRLLCLPAGSDYDDDQRLTWIAVGRVRDEATVHVPLAFVASEPDELAVDRGRPLIVPITNGLGAGLDPERALSHGIGEIVQRHTNGLRFRALDARSPVIEGTGLPTSVRALVDRFAESGVQVVIKHAATAFGMFSCYAMGLDDDLRDPIRLTACGEAAHPSPEASMTKAVLEYANSRARKAFCFGDNPRVEQLAPDAYWRQLPRSAGEPRAMEAMRAWARTSASELKERVAPDLSRTVALQDIAPVAMPAGEDVLGWQRAQLAGHDVLCSLSRTGEVWTAKTIITELEVETLSYGRIGEAGVRESIEADLDLVRIGQRPGGDHRHRVALTAEAEERLGGAAWYSYQRAADIVGPLYPLYREPPRHAVTVGTPR